jgi:NAD(P)-dependent dehydrogenase (short-subunit alcohol dehydrogenase family)
MPLTNHVILITGAGGGLGSTAALALAKQRAHIILLDKNIAKLEKVYDAILAANAPEPIIYPFDLAGANETEYQELADKIDEKYGSLQGILHSAVEFSAFPPSPRTNKTGAYVKRQPECAFLLCRVGLPVCKNGTSIVLRRFCRKRQPIGAYGVSK